jgi:hypothetical protein
MYFLKYKIAATLNYQITLRTLGCYKSPLLVKISTFCSYLSLEKVRAFLVRLVSSRSHDASSAQFLYNLVINHLMIAHICKNCLRLLDPYEVYFSFVSLLFTIWVLGIMESDSLSPSSENGDAKTTFRKPSTDAANRKYRRRSPVGGSSSSDG